MSDELVDDFEIEDNRTPLPDNDEEETEDLEGVNDSEEETEEGAPEQAKLAAEVVTPKPESVLTVAPALWEQSAIKIVLMLGAHDNPPHPAGRPLTIGVQVAEAAPVMRSMREVDLGKFPASITRLLSELRAEMEGASKKGANGNADDDLLVTNPASKPAATSQKANKAGAEKERAKEVKPEEVAAQLSAFDF